MPLYTYQCDDCKFKFEILYFSGDQEPVCPQCGSRNTNRSLLGGRSFSCPGAGGSSCSGSCESCKGCCH